MNTDDWKLEMNRMLDLFANQAEYSLEKINRCFEALGRPFDEKFRQHYLKMTNQRFAIRFSHQNFSFMLKFCSNSQHKLIDFPFLTFYELDWI